MVNGSISIVLVAGGVTIFIVCDFVILVCDLSYETGPMRQPASRRMSPVGGRNSPNKQSLGGAWGGDRNSNDPICLSSLSRLSSFSRRLCSADPSFFYLSPHFPFQGVLSSLECRYTSMAWS